MIWSAMEESERRLRISPVYSGEKQLLSRFRCSRLFIVESKVVSREKHSSDFHHLLSPAKLAVFTLLAQSESSIAVKIFWPSFASSLNLKRSREARLGLSYAISYVS